MARTNTDRDRTLPGRAVSPYAKFVVTFACDSLD